MRKYHCIYKISPVNDRCASKQSDLISAGSLDGIIIKDIIHAFEELQKMSRLVSFDRKPLKQVLSTTRPSSVTISIEAKPTFSRSNPINK